MKFKAGQYVKVNGWYDDKFEGYIGQIVTGRVTEFNDVLVRFDGCNEGHLHDGRNIDGMNFPTANYWWIQKHDLEFALKGTLVELEEML